MKFLSFFILSLSAAATASCQIKYIPPTAHMFSFGAGAGITTLYGDFYGKPNKVAEWAELDYNLTPYIAIGFNGQYGLMTTGGLDVTRKEDGFYVDNTYTTVNLNARVSLGAFLGHVPLSRFVEIINGIYGGVGVGVINNSIKPYTKGGLNQNLISPLVTSSTTQTLPLNAGIDINVPKIFGYTGLMVNVNYQYVFTGSDIVDGYDPAVRFNKAKDTYTYLSAGLRFNFGPIR